MKTNRPYWFDSANVPKFPTLKRNLKVDVAIVGAGITGITAAYLIAKTGKKIALIERERCVRRDTGHTTAHVTYVTDLRCSELVSDFGRDHARAIWDAGAAAMQEIRSIVDELDIACELRTVPAYLHAPLDSNGEGDWARLEKDARLARELGFDATFLESVPLIHRCGIRFANQAKFHPRKYLAGILKAVIEMGGSVFEETSCDEILEKPLRVKANGKQIRCKYVIIATHVPLQGTSGTLEATLFQTKLAPYSSYAIGARVPSGTIPEASYWDTSDPYYYLRVDAGKGHDYAIFGGEDHKTGQKSNTQERFQRLERKLHNLVPQAVVQHRWSGQVIETNDGLPFIGESSAHEFIATGYAGNGMTFGTVAAMMARDVVQGRTNPWRDLFAPSRKSIRAGAWDYLKENKDYPFYYIKDRLTKARTKSWRSLKPGQGAVLEIDGEKVATFRGKQGEVARCSAVCTHMGCIVEWNNAEKTWDCPCHGSRVRTQGTG